MKPVIFSLIMLFNAQLLFCQTLSISENGRHIVKADGTPFFWLGDTAWELFHRLDREEADLYVKNRAAKGFNVIQAVVLAELDGLNDPNPYGEVPLINNDPTKPNEAYFNHVDYIVNEIANAGMYIGMLPTWGDKFNKKWGKGHEIFTQENAFTFGKFLGERYKDKPVIWILGGDRNPDNEEDIAIIDQMAKGIKAGDEGTHLMTYHPQGESNSSEFFHDRDWLDFNMFQSGHGKWDNPNYKWNQHNYNLIPIKPTFDAEPRYEDHPVGWNPENGWFNEFDTRQAAYWNILSGGCGHTYGNHNIWQMYVPGRNPISAARTPWYEGLDYPGAFQMGIMKAFFESIAWESLQPIGEILSDDRGARGSQVLAAFSKDKQVIVAYSPYGRSFELPVQNQQDIQLKYRWFNPRNGTYINPKKRALNESVQFDPPADPERGNDWVLIIESNLPLKLSR